MREREMKEGNSISKVNEMEKNKKVSDNVSKMDNLTVHPSSVQLFHSKILVNIQKNYKKKELLAQNF